MTSDTCKTIENTMICEILDDYNNEVGAGVTFSTEFKTAMYCLICKISDEYNMSEEDLHTVLPNIFRNTGGDQYGKSN